MIAGRIPKMAVSAVAWGVTGLFVLELFALFGAPLLPGIASPVSFALQEHDEERASAPAAQLPADASARIRIRALDLSASIVFPNSTDERALDAALAKGVVHYPLSALPGENSGNVFLFGHSTSRSVVVNPAYTVFTKLNRVRTGEEIEVTYNDRVYVYRVRAVRVLKPGEAEVYFKTPERMLTLSTCWPIGDPENRFIVEAGFARSYPRRTIASGPGTST